MGRYLEAAERAREGAEISAQQGNPAAGLGQALVSVVVHIEKREFDEAVQATHLLEEVISEIPNPTFRNNVEKVAHFVAGMAEVRQANLDAGREHLGSLAEVYDAEDEIERWFYETLNGEIALAAGDLATAEEAFTRAEPEFKMFFNMGSGGQNILPNNSTLRDGLARVKKAQGDLAGAISIYRELLTSDISSKWTAMLEPRYVLELGRLLDASGDPAAARAEYERFLDLWKNADPGLPELEEARQYLAN